MKGNPIWDRNDLLFIEPLAILAFQSCIRTMRLLPKNIINRANYDNALSIMIYQSKYDFYTQCDEFNDIKKVVILKELSKFIYRSVKNEISMSLEARSDYNQCELTFSYEGNYFNLTSFLTPKPVKCLIYNNGHNILKRNLTSGLLKCIDVTNGQWTTITLSFRTAIVRDITVSVNARFGSRKDLQDIEILRQVFGSLFSKDRHEANSCFTEILTNIQRYGYYNFVIGVNNNSFQFLIGDKKAHDS